MDQLNLPENIFENQYKAGQHLKFTMNVAYVFQNLVATLKAYKAFVASKDLELTPSLLVEQGIIHEQKSLPELLSVHDVLACLFGQYDDLDIEAAWNSYVKNFTEQVANADLKDASFTIFKAYCFSAFKEESVGEDESETLNG